ncbi:MAG: hypothetical protein HOF72_06630, partial [Planctomycetaceae bacterium]|nr:hypothetical protein [Planctomycetaceae bacterium]
MFRSTPTPINLASRAHSKSWMVLAATLCCLILATCVQAASPSLSLILPRGVQRGVENKISFRGARLDDAEEIFFYSPGFEVTKIEPSASAAVATVNIAADCR